MAGSRIYAADDMILLSRIASFPVFGIDDCLHQIISPRHATAFTIGAKVHSGSARAVVHSAINPDFSTMICADRFGNTYLDESYDGLKEHRRTKAAQASEDFAIAMKDYSTRFKNEALAGELPLDFIFRLETQEGNAKVTHKDIQMINDPVSEDSNFDTASHANSSNNVQTLDDSRPASEMCRAENLIEEHFDPAHGDDDYHYNRMVAMLRSSAPVCSAAPGVSLEDLALTSLIPIEDTARQLGRAESSLDFIGVLNKEKDRLALLATVSADLHPSSSVDFSAPTSVKSTSLAEDKVDPETSHIGPLSGIRGSAIAVFPGQCGNKTRSSHSSISSNAGDCLSDALGNGQKPIATSTLSHPRPRSSDSGYVSGSGKQTADSSPVKTTFFDIGAPDVSANLNMPTHPWTTSSACMEENKKQGELIKELRAQITIKDADIEHLRAELGKFEIHAGYVGAIGVTNEMHELHLKIQEQSMEEEREQEIQAAAAACRHQLQEGDRLHHSLLQKSKRRLMQSRQKVKEQKEAHGQAMRKKEEEVAAAHRIRSRPRDTWRLETNKVDLMPNESNFGTDINSLRQAYQGLEQSKTDLVEQIMRRDRELQQAYTFAEDRHENGLVGAVELTHTTTKGCQCFACIKHDQYDDINQRNTVIQQQNIRMNTMEQQIATANHDMARLIEENRRAALTIAQRDARTKEVELQNGHAIGEVREVRTDNVRLSSLLEERNARIQELAQHSTTALLHDWRRFAQENREARDSLEQRDARIQELEEEVRVNQQRLGWATQRAVD
ncbi:MAG: hypothetical protein M1822_002193 [Bathelium mastoideum]|nr:MAG: hypothetical protein M1822_002193 [Bathelium mastoideum]